jgi:hypothetical protein
MRKISTIVKAPDMVRGLFWSFQIAERPGSTSVLPEDMSRTPLLQQPGTFLPCSELR